MRQRQKKKTNRQEEIQRILEELIGVKSTTCTNSGSKRTLIPKVKSDKGETITITWRRGIANVFGEFYSKLYAENQLGEDVQDPQNLETRMNTEGESCNDDVRNETPEFTQDEAQAAIDSLKKR